MSNLGNLAGFSSSFSLDMALTSLSASFNSIEKLIKAMSYIIGLALVVRGLMMYRALANQTMSTAQRGEIAGPAVHIVVGAIMFYFPSTLSTTLNTVFGTSQLTEISQIIDYPSLAQSERWSKLSEIIQKYMYLIGLIAFVRGWVLLSKMGHAGAQPGQIGKGLIHIIGGILLINIVQTVNILAETFGYIPKG